MYLNRKGLLDGVAWENAQISLPKFDVEKMLVESKAKPQWLHFGPGNIFRAFLAPLAQQLLETGDMATGIIAVAPYDNEVIEKIYKPHDNLTLLVTMYADNRMDKKVLSSISESLTCHTQYAEDWRRLQDIMRQPSLQMISFTITEKGYKIKDIAGVYTAEVDADMRNGLAAPKSFMGRMTALAYERYLAGQYPVAFVSMDNCSHNGLKLKASLVEIAAQWVENGFIEAGFLVYLNDTTKVAFPCSMIDKITPRPSEKVQKMLVAGGVEGMDLVQSARGSYYAPFVNAEKTEYLVIEDAFPNGRLPLEKAGVIFTTRETVDCVERMKVCTCLNPLHTAMATIGCLLGYTLIADEMNHPQIRKLVENIGYVEGMPVVTNPGVLEPKKFLQEVIEQRLTNGNIPDTPQRIASDTSQKVGVRFGETIKAYVADEQLQVTDLIYIPLAIAGWCRYLLGIDDQGKMFQISPDPLLAQLQEYLAGVTFGKPESLTSQLVPILSNQEIFGSDLYAVGLGKKIEGYVKEMLVGVGAVDATLKKYVK